MAHGSQDCLDVGGPGYEKGKRRDCVVRYRAIYTSMYYELSDDYAYHAPFYTLHMTESPRKLRSYVTTRGYGQG